MLRSAAMFFARCSRYLPLRVALTAWPGAACQPATQSPPASPEPAAPTATDASTSTSPRPASDARARARALLAQMTREEKAASLVHVFDWTYKKTADQLCHALPL